MKPPIVTKIKFKDSNWVQESIGYIKSITYVETPPESVKCIIVYSPSNGRRHEPQLVYRAIGYAKIHDKDIYDRKIGRALAFSKAICNAMYLSQSKVLIK